MDPPLQIIAWVTVWDHSLGIRTLGSLLQILTYAGSIFKSYNVGPIFRNLNMKSTILEISVTHHFGITIKSPLDLFILKMTKKCLSNKLLFMKLKAFFFLPNILIIN